jgi:hypothetical protein
MGSRQVLVGHPFYPQYGGMFLRNVQKIVPFMVTSVKTSNPTMMRFINMYDEDTFSFAETPISLLGKEIRDTHLFIKNYSFH